MIGKKIVALITVLILISTVLVSSSDAQGSKEFKYEGEKETRSVITVLVIDPNSNQVLDIANYILGRNNTFWEDLQANYTSLNIVRISPTDSLSTAISTYSPKVIVLSDLNLKFWELHENNNYATLKSFTQNGGGLVITHGTFFDLTISIEGATYNIGPNKHVGLKDDLSGVEFDSLNTLTGLGYLTLFEALKIYLAEIIGYIVSAIATPAAGETAEALFKSIPLTVPYVPFNGSMVAENTNDPLLSNMDIIDHTFCLDIDCPICRGTGNLSAKMRCWLCTGDGDLDGKSCPLCKGDSWVFDDCFACGGTGEFGMGIFSGMCGEGNCALCDGDGKMNCPFNESITCVGCDGDGKIDCSICGGDGWFGTCACIWCGGSVGDPLYPNDDTPGRGWYGCPLCGGFGGNVGSGNIDGWCSGGKLTCAGCDGDGNVTCPLCEGNGKLGCPLCTDGKINCTCANSIWGPGKVDCALCTDGKIYCVDEPLGCGGDGMVACSICNGSAWGPGKVDCILCTNGCYWCGYRGWNGCSLCGGDGAGTAGRGWNGCSLCGGDGWATAGRGWNGCGGCGGAFGTPGRGWNGCLLCGGGMGTSGRGWNGCGLCGGAVGTPGRGWFGCLGCGGDLGSNAGRGWNGCILCGGNGGDLLGKGWNPCLACGGSLENPVEPWDDKPGRGWITCPFCTGVFICPFCNGTGEPISTTCYYCNGTGKAPYTLVGWQLEYPELIAEKVLEEFESFINSTNAMFSPATHELNHILGISTDHNEINQKMLEASKELRKFFRKMYEARCALPNITINVPNITLAVPMPEGTKNITITENRTINITLPAEVANIICGLLKPAEIVALSSDKRAAILKYEAPTHRSVYFSFKPESTSNAMNQRLMYNAINWSSITPPPLPSIVDLIVPENVKNTYDQIKGQYNNFFSFTEKVNTSGIVAGAGNSTHQINIQDASKIVSLLTSSSGKVKLKLISPSGIVYSDTGTNVRKVEITNPEDGVWTVQAESLGNGEGVMDLYRLETNINTQPTASFSANLTTVYTYENITFDASFSHDNDLNGAITQFYFDFGDGTTSGWQTQATASHHYTDDGLYNVRAKVKDNLGAESDWSSITTVTVKNRPPEITSYGPTMNPTITEEGSQMFTVSAYDLDDTTITVKWYLNNSLVSTTTSYTFIANYTSAGWHEVKVIVSDGELSVSHIWTLTVTNVNRKPIINSYEPVTNPTITEEQNQLFAVSVSDPDGDIPVVSWYLNDTLVGIGTSYTFTANYTSAGSYNIKVIVSDDELSVNHIWILNVVNVNRVPIVISITADSTTVNTSGTTTITVDATDEDTGDVLTYHYSCTGGTISGTGSSVTWTAPGTAGDYTITVYVNDGTVNSNSKSVQVTVEPPPAPKEEPKGFIPGFEATYIVIMLGVCVLLLKRRKK